MAKAIVAPVADQDDMSRRDLQDNEYFNANLIDRAPYELRNLLYELPEDLVSRSMTGSLTRTEIDIADAARHHADNYLSTLLDGIESIGAALYSSVESSTFQLSDRHVRHIAYFIQTMAVEAQHLRETEDRLLYALNENELASQKSEASNMRRAA